MAITITVNDKKKVNAQFGEKTEIEGTLAFGSSYTTNGESFTLVQLGLEALDRMVCEATLGYVLQVDLTNKKIKAYYADYSTSTDGALIEVAAEVNLSGAGLTAVPFFASGDEVA